MIDLSRCHLALAAVAFAALSACETTAAHPAVTPAATPASSSTWRYSTDPPVHPTFADVAYAGTSPQEKLDLYLPRKTSGRAPLVIWIHGGHFNVGDKSAMPRRDFGPPPKPASPMDIVQIQVPDEVALTARGYAVVSMNYRMGADATPETVLAATQDAKAAVRFLRANAGRYGLDPGRFAVWGNSAGAYMAVMLGTTGDQATHLDDPSLGNPGVSGAVQAVVDWYGPMIGFDDSPISYIPTARTLPAFLIANGAADPRVTPDNPQALQTALVRAGATSTLTILPGASHEDPAFMATQMAPTFAFLDRTFGRR
jgi:acetyl esterase/lipase